MTFQIQIGLDVISSYKRLAYTPWHAIAEFVDNSTQSYLDNRDLLDSQNAGEPIPLEISIIYEGNVRGGLLSIADNAMGMNESELNRALHVALPPENNSGRCRYGMGLKTAACWIGNNWSIKTKKFGERYEYFVEIDVAKIASGNSSLESKVIEKDLNQHYTIIEIRNHNRKFQGRTLGKIREFLGSMYREDFRAGYLDLKWQLASLTWNEFEDRILIARDGEKYKKGFDFIVNGKRVHGWVGILDRGSRADAGFSILHSGRVIKGWPDSWRPSSIYGQMQGSNDLINQRLLGEIHLDAFEVSHTKDDILWLGDEEEIVEEKLLEFCNDYKSIALSYRRRSDDERGPSDTEIAAAINEFQREITSPEMVDRIVIEEVPSEESVRTSLDALSFGITCTHDPNFLVRIDSLSVKLYLVSDMSPQDYYVVTETHHPAEVVVIINTAHPHWGHLSGSEGVLNYLRDCTYDAVAEWQARKKTSRIDPDTIKILKDRLLRVPFELEQHENGGVLHE